MVDMRTSLLLLVMACSSPPAAAPPPPPPASPASCSVAGAWVGDGDDDKGVHWTYQLQLGQAGNQLAGTIQWHASSVDGSEDVTGTLDCSAHQLAMRGLNASAGLANTSYTVAITDDGARISGRWACPDGGCAAGTLRGHRP
jgi:hypothetical protein